MIDGCIIITYINNKLYYAVVFFPSNLLERLTEISSTPSDITADSEIIIIKY
jgi:hypothetical protein